MTNRLDTEAATRTQVGALCGELNRFGIRGHAERVSVCAALLDLDELHSTLDLTMGECGKLIGTLRGLDDRDELDELVTRAKAARRRSEPASLAGILGRAAAALASALNR